MTNTVYGRFYNTKVMVVVAAIVEVLLIPLSRILNQLGNVFYKVAPFWVLVGLPLFLAVCALYFCIGRCEITVTEKSVKGKAAFGKQVNLPIDSISAVGTVGVFKGISVATSAGSISFLMLSNAQEVYDAINDLISHRQEKPVVVNQIQEHQSNADELKKYKELLDSGVISQEEFDAKKKQLLGL